MDQSEQLRILEECFPFLSGRELHSLIQLSEYVHFAPKDTLIRNGQYVSKLFFILEGMVRGYFVDEKGEERNMFLRPKHTFTGSPGTLFLDKPSKYTFEAIPETHVLFFDFENIQELAMSNRNLFRMYMSGFQENILTLISRVEAMANMRPEERYEALLTRSPQFFETAYHKHIANYLGITPVSLSRIMNRRKEKG